MSITVARIENLFWWNNSAYKKPNGLPEFKESVVIRRRPVIYDFMGGRTHLLGDQWNYAIYEGTYYFLKIDKTYDLKKGHFSYVLVRDLWMNIILKYTVGVKGRLSATKRDEWLQANLNRTFPILLDPVEVTRIGLFEENYELTKHTNIRIPFVDLRMPYLSKKEIEDFKTTFVEYAQTYKKNFENKHISNNKSPIFIFSSLKGNQSYVYSWKENLKKRLIDYLKDFKNQKGKIVISKVGGSFSNLLQGKYCLTWIQGGIGYGRESAQIQEIDLSKLTDIVPLSIGSTKPLDSITGQPYMRDLDESLFEEFRDFHYKEQKRYKFRRKIYFPFTQNEEECGIAVITKGEDQKILRDVVNWKFHCPQKLETEIGTLFLTFLSDINFSLDYNPGTMKDRFKNSLPTVQIEWPYPRHSYNDVADEPFWNSDLKTDLGFLIFDVYNANIFEGFKCTSKTPIKQIQYFSGIKKSTLLEISSGRIFNKNFYELPYLKDDWFKYKDSINQNWRRYWHNLTSGLEILLMPNQKGYSYAYRALNATDRLSNNYSIRTLQTVDNVWGGEAPFKNLSVHKKTLSKTKRLIKDLTMKTLVDIPIELKENDYLFNDLRYWIDEIDFEKKFVKGDEAKNISFVTSAYDTNNLLFEDFLRNPKDIVENKKEIVICNTEEGKIEIRTLESFSLIHKLHGGIYSEKLSEVKTDVSESLNLFTGETTDASVDVDDLYFDEQGLYSVDQVTSKRVGYIALKKIDNGEVTDISKPLDQRLLNIALNKFLSLNGYIVSALTTTEKTSISKVLWYKDSDFDGINPLLFDLKGTDWFLYIKQGRISLIAKNPDIFTKTLDQVKTLKKNQKLNSLSVLEKVNQKCVLTVETHERKLKTRFNFDNEKFDLTVSSPKPATQMGGATNFFYISLRSDFDVIERDIITVPKTQLDSSDNSNYIELEKLRMQMLRSDREYEVSMEKNIGFQTERLTEEFRRRKWDLETAKYKTWINGILSIVTGGLLGSSGSKEAWNEFADETGFSATNWLGLKMTGALGFGLGAGRAVNNLFWANRDLTEKTKRMEIDRQFAFRDLAYQSLQITLSHRDVQEDSIRNLNETAHIYRKGTINNTYLMDEFRKEIGISGKSYLTVFTPSREQLKLLSAHKEEFGVECDIPSAIIEIKQGMPEEVIKFKNLEDTGVVGVPNLLEREYLIGILEKGIKVVNIYANQIEDFNEYVCTNIKQLSRELESRRIQSIKDEVQTGRLNAKIRQLEEELSKRTTLTQEEIDKKEADLAKAKEELNNLRIKDEEKDKKVKELADKLELLDRQIKEKSSECESKNNEYLSAIEEVKKLNEEIQNLKTQSANYRKLWDAEIKAKDAAQKELNKCKEEATKHEEKIKETIIATEKAFDERVKGLEGKIKSKDTEITNLKNSLNKKDSDITNLKSELNKAKDAAKGTCPEYKVNVCELLKNLAKSSDYELDLKIKDNGFSAFTDLVFELADSIRRMRVASVDFHLAHFDFMRPIIQKLLELEQIDIVDKAEQIIQMPGYTNFVEWLKSGGNRNGDVDNVISKTNDLKIKVTMPVVHQVWSLLDELNYLVFKARSEKTKEISEDTDLDFFFKHIYPGQDLNNLYKTLFELEPEFAITKKEYLKAQCVPTGEGKNPIEWISEKTKEVKPSINVPKSSRRPDGLPPSTATLRQQDNSEIVLDDTYVFPYFFPTSKGIKKYYTQIKPDGKIVKVFSVNWWAFYRGSTKKYAYTRGGKKWSWWDFSNNLFYPGSPNSNESYFYEQEVYIRSREINIFKLVHSNRKQHWKNKDKIQIPDALKEAIKNKQPFWKYLYVRNWQSFNGKCSDGRTDFWSNYWGYTDEPLTIDLVKVFGQKAGDAYRLLGILDVAKWYFDAYERNCADVKNKYDGLPAIEFFYRIFSTDDSSYTNLNNDFYSRLNRNNIITDEFLNTFCLINYIWYHIKNPGVELKSVFDFGTSKKNIDEMCTFANNWKIQTD